MRPPGARENQGRPGGPAVGMAIADKPVMAIADFETALEHLGWRQDSPSGARAPLSPREQQIIGLLAGGRTQKETAYELGVADATVRVLYSRAMKKLGRSKHPRAKESARP
jgi:DNA-binding NarL/FixJ family response regulator